MSVLARLYQPGLALLTDLYELTMAYGYWKSGVADREAVFNLFFRRNPFGGGFAIACGLPQALDYIRSFRFQDDDLVYLRGLTGRDGKPLFDRAFLDALADLRFTGDVDGIPEGRVVFPNEPLLRVQGPIMECQILETFLVNALNFQSLVATKAARVCLAAEGDLVVEFGARRAQGPDGAVSASRAAYVGGCAGTSNVLAGRLYDIPVKGTHAHSWVECFDDEPAAFRAWADAMPNNAVFLVDTYDSLQGVRNAVEVGKRLREQGHEMVGVRLDSGDLAYLSIEARKILDEGGFPDAVIMASGDLDEHIISSLKQQKAEIHAWGVGTRLATAYDQPALGCVYKLVAVREPGGPWREKLKLSEQIAKTTIPGILQVRRYRVDGECRCDMLYDVRQGSASGRIVDPADPTRRRYAPEATTHEDLLVPLMRGGEPVAEPDTAAQARDRAQKDLAQFHWAIKRFVNPHEYPVGLEQGLHEYRQGMILQAREEHGS